MLDRNHKENLKKQRVVIAKKQLYENVNNNYYYNFYVAPISIRNIFFSAVQYNALYRRKGSRIDYSSKALENMNVLNLDLEISMLCESRLL